MEKKIFKVSKPSPKLTISGTIMEWNKETGEWEEKAINHNHTSYKMPILTPVKETMDNINEYIEANNKNAELFNSFANVTLGVPYKPKN